MTIPEVYVLPTIDFVGGSTQELAFHCYFYRNKLPFELTGCTAEFAVINFVNKNGAPVVTKSMDVDADPGRDGDVENVLRVTLSPADTVDVPAGKYVYQISVKDGDGTVEIPKQGIFHIINNIDKAFARG